MIDLTNPSLLFQIEHHPRITKYMAENYRLREENCQLRSSESVRRAEEVDSQAAAELEKAFQKVLEAEGSAGGKHGQVAPLLK